MIMYLILIKKHRLIARDGTGMDKRYQVFVSSTYEDLKVERKEVTQAILRCGCFPAGMELFPASSKDKWEVLKAVIDDSDIYLVILAGRYGSLGIDDDGNEVGYTEMEYDYAVSQGKPVIALLHQDVDLLPAKYVDGIGTEGRSRLEAFRAKIQSARMTRYWTSKEDLSREVLASLQNVVDHDGSGLIGWIRADQIVIDQKTINDYLSSVLAEGTYYCNVNRDIQLQLRFANESRQEGDYIRNELFANRLLAPGDKEI